MRKIIFILLLNPSVVFSQQYDDIILNGKIIDGTGNSWFYGDVAIKDGKILYVGKTNNATAIKVINAKGLIVAPGFIDVHGHIEGGIFETPSADNYIHDGVTTVITGNCGGSADDLKKFFFYIDSVKTAINVASLIGHNTVRELVIGLDNRLATPEEQKKMETLVEQAMKDGAVGLSTGLIYLPGMYSNSEEIIGLAKVAGAYNGLYVSHIRNEDSRVVDAINEAINVGEQANIRVQISHFKIGYPANWGRSKETLSLIEKARKEGYDVTIDQYPFTAGSTGLEMCLPGWAVAGGWDSLKARITDPIWHKKIINDMLIRLKDYKFKNYSYAVVAGYGADTTWIGKNISEINKLRGRKDKAAEEAETILYMMKAGGAAMVYHTMNEDDVRYFMKYPFNMVGADADAMTPDSISRPHPRAYGTNARVLAKYVREEKIVSLEEIIRRMTSLAAQKFQLKDRGLLREGYAADIVIFNEAEVNDKATFENPHQFSVGFKYVLVNGKLEMEDGKQNTTRSGRSLKGPGTF
jgi:N-acyl-D-amino-acid deacylase